VTEEGGIRSQGIYGERMLRSRHQKTGRRGGSGYGKKKKGGYVFNARMVYGGGSNKKNGRRVGKGGGKETGRATPQNGRFLAKKTEFTRHGQPRERGSQEGEKPSFTPGGEKKK